MPTHRNQQGMTKPRSLRLIAVDVIETPFSHLTALRALEPASARFACK